jgi:hypothetical protein
MASTLTLDPHTARFFAPGEQTGPVGAYTGIGGRGVPRSSWEARLANDMSGTQRVVLRPERERDSNAPSFLLDPHPCRRFLGLGPGSVEVKRYWMDVPGEARFPAFWRGLQRAHYDASGWGVLFRGHGQGTLADLRPGKDSGERFHPFVGEWRMEPDAFVSMPDERFHVLAAESLEDASSDLGRTWAYLRLDEEARCREAFGCTSFAWKRVREVLGWALVWECGPELLHGDRSRKTNPALWYYWLEDESALKLGRDELRPITPFLRAWRDAVAGYYGCSFLQIKPIDYFIESGRYHACKALGEDTPPVPTPGPRRAFKRWIKPTLLRCKAPTANEVLIARQQLEAWAKDHLPAPEAARLMKAHSR